MQQAIDLTLNRDFKIRNFEEDKTATLDANPGLRFEGVVKGFQKFSGSFYLKNEQGELIESFNVVIAIEKKKYPNTFPLLFSTDNKIDRNPDYHIGDNGEVCLEHPYIINKLSSGGIRLHDFVKYYLHRYFSWVLVKKYGSAQNLLEWKHREYGTIQLYQELIGTTDNKIIHQFLKNYCERPKRYPNDSCFCGSNLKLKKCHYEAAVLLKSTPIKSLLLDVKLFEDNEKNTT